MSRSSRAGTGDRPALRKPLDAGNGLVAASFSPSGAWLSLGTFHSHHGTVEVTNLPPFDERWRGDARVVRRYRRWMTEERFAFLRAVPASGHEWRVDEAAQGTPPTMPAIEQSWRIKAPAGRTGRIELRFRGRLDRPALAEITEVSPPQPLLTSTRLDPQGPILAVTADLPAVARVAVRVVGGSTDGWRHDGDGARLVVVWSGRAELTITCTLSEGCNRARAGGRGSGATLARTGPIWVDQVHLHLGSPHRDGLTRIAAGAIRYVTGCTHLYTGPGEACLLTDHRLLPLSWTRDAYYQALLLLAAGTRSPSHLERVAEHLRWLWGRCRRDGGYWQRSHLANGEPKDIAFQADQQLYPLLELLDFRAATGRWPTPAASPRGRELEWGPLADDLWRGLPVSAQGLVATEENPADDPSSLPFSLSTQILYWYVTRRLAAVAGELFLDEARLRAAAGGIRAAVDRHFEAQTVSGVQWAYEVDGRGASRLYADANDLPTAFAPAWGFCPPDHQPWLATMRFAFSEENPGYCPGSYGGLGSLHTPGTWPLGDVQEWVAAENADQPDRAERALERLTKVASSDGLLPEAYDPATGRWTARHWFAWPAAVVGALALPALGS